MPFCANCGNELQSDTKFCPKCGTSISGKRRPEEGSITENKAKTFGDGAIWNPNAASNWSLLFTPAFGSYLHARNWRALGVEKKAKTSMAWFYVSIIMLLLGIIINASSAGEENFAAGIGFLFLIIWYFISGRSQAEYVKKRFGKEYMRRGWGKPLLIAVGGLIGYFVISVIALAANGTNPLTASRGGYPTCTSANAADQFKSVFDGSSYAGRMSLKVVNVTNQKKVSESKNGNQLTCQATLMLNNAQDMTYQFTFKPAKDRVHFYVEGQPVR